MTLKIFIGWDSREPEAAEVCEYSIKKHATVPVEIHFLKQAELRAQEIYTREPDLQSSTEFTFTRFLVPYLCNYQGNAVFVDCDFLFEHDIKELFECANNSAAVSVVQHDYQPTNTVKMDGKTQYLYPRKNWSSLMLFNCAHPDCQTLTPEIVSSQTGEFLHRFAWTGYAIGSLDKTWNWLVNWYHEPQDGKPKAIHYTEGGPWFPNYVKTEYGGNWIQAYTELTTPPPPPPPPPPDPHILDQVTTEIRQIFDNILKYRVDPEGLYHDITLDTLTQQIAELPVNQIVALDSEYRYERKGYKYDPLLQSFVQGAGGQISTWDKEQHTMTPVVLRGITKSGQINGCRAAGRDFYYMDSGYFGNGKQKLYHRITKNDVQNFGPIINRPSDRFDRTGIRLTKFKSGNNILLAPPSQKLLNLYDINLEEWLEQTQDEIKKYTDRPVITRLKQTRAARISENTMEMALAQNIHCLVTFSSIAAGEALLLGKPAITLGPNAAAALCSQSLSEIENPKIPTLDEVAAWARHIAYCQFTEAEMRDGTAWRILNDH
jgi:hypothetical protein